MIQRDCLLEVPLMTADTRGAQPNEDTAGGANMAVLALQGRVGTD